MTTCKNQITKYNLKCMPCNANQHELTNLKLVYIYIYVNFHQIYQRETPTVTLSSTKPYTTQCSTIQGFYSPKIQPNSVDPNSKDPLDCSWYFTTPELPKTLKGAHPKTEDPATKSWRVGGESMKTQWVNAEKKQNK